MITAVDVTSTESATNVTARGIATAAGRARRLVGRAAGAGREQRRRSFGGVSFGGSSVAENTVYINGLNVTDFYNRDGFSAVPFAFYKEFQVKTGGYSVEFGRTTGGVINAVDALRHERIQGRRGAAFEPRAWQIGGNDRTSTARHLTMSKDDYRRRSSMSGLPARS